MTGQQPLPQAGDLIRCACCGYEARVVARRWVYSAWQDGRKVTHTDPVSYYASSSTRLPLGSDLCLHCWWRQELGEPEYPVVDHGDGEILAEVRRLMADDVVERPCRYLKHAASVWFNQAGGPVCGICHPRAKG